MLAFHSSRPIPIKKQSVIIKQCNYIFARSFNDYSSHLYFGKLLVCLCNFQTRVVVRLLDLILSNLYDPL